MAAWCFFSSLQAWRSPVFTTAASCPGKASIPSKRDQDAWIFWIHPFGSAKSMEEKKGNDGIWWYIAPNTCIFDIWYISSNIQVLHKISQLQSGPETTTCWKKTRNKKLPELSKWSHVTMEWHLLLLVRLPYLTSFWLHRQPAECWLFCSRLNERCENSWRFEEKSVGCIIILLDCKETT